MRQTFTVLTIASLSLLPSCGLKPSGEAFNASDLKRHGNDDSNAPEDHGRGHDDVNPDDHGNTSDDECREDGDDHQVKEDSSSLLRHGRGRGRGRGQGNQSGGGGQTDDRCQQNPSPPPTEGGGNGGGGPGGGGGDNSGPPLSYQDVAPIIQGACVKCHNPSGAADFLPLQTFAQVQSARQSMISAIASGFMPMGNAAFKSSPEAGTLLKWLRSGQN